MATLDGVTRGELDAKLQTIEARMDSRITRMESLVERSVSSTDELKKEFREAKWWAIGTAFVLLTIFLSVLYFLSQQEQSWTQTFLSSFVTHKP